jgi:hypothetical protein
MTFLNLMLLLYILLLQQFEFKYLCACLFVTIETTLIKELINLIKYLL